MEISPDTHATLLLTVRLPGDGGTPLTPGSYGALARWLHGKGLRPADLLGDGPDLADLGAAGLDAGQVRALLGRGVSLALHLDRWRQRGLWVLGRGDAGYPARLRRVLKALAPPILFGAGDPALLGRDMVAVVGSRDADEGALAFARQVGASAAAAGLALASGAARGIDRAAMDAALEAGGPVVGVMAEGLEKPVAGRDIRDLVRDGRGCFLSPFEPDARWTVGRAMERNKLVYGLSRATLVARSDTRGGTWEGARENLRRGWVPCAVWADGPPAAGNEALLQAGAHPVGLGQVRDGDALLAWLDGLRGPVADPLSAAADRGGSPAEPTSPPTGAAGKPPGDPVALLPRLLDALAGSPLSLAEVATTLGLPKSKAKDLVDLAITGGHAIRPGRNAKVQAVKAGAGPAQGRLL